MSKIKIFIVAPGILPLPATGPGAVENILTHYYEELSKRDDVEIVLWNDPNLAEAAKYVNNPANAVDFVHVHYDDHIPYMVAYCNCPVYGTTHFGWIHHKEKWEHYPPIHSGVLEAAGLICLSQEIANVYRRDGFVGPLRILRNGVEVEKYKFEPVGGVKDLICLGTVEHRKGHPKLVEFCERYGLNLDLVGPIGDFSPPDGLKYVKYLGVWDKETVRSRLTDYKALVLVSEGEADPLVTKEAMAAGLSLIVSDDAKANLPWLEKWIYLTDLKDPDSRLIIRDKFRKILEQNAQFRTTIRHTAETRYAWKVIVDEYVRIVKELVALQNKGR
jgi:glycosyltransferase involved in cell wall biosynthesis